MEISLPYIYLSIYSIRYLLAFPYLIGLKIAITARRSPRLKAIAASYCPTAALRRMNSSVAGTSHAIGIDSSTSRPCDQRCALARASTSSL